MSKEKEQTTVPQSNKGAKRIHLFTLCVLLMIVVFKTSQTEFLATYFKQNPRLALHTGFPPLEDLKGITVFPGKAAAVAFTPKPISTTGESWWDRLFPHRHVHLTSVQIPVCSKNQTIHGLLSICPGERLSAKGFPDLERCVSTVSLNTTKDDGFGVLMWEPEEVVVLKKSSSYWLVVQSPNSLFKWVYSQKANDESIFAFQNENGWQMQLKDEPVPSVMIMIEEH